MKKLFVCFGAVAVLVCTGCGPSADTSTSAPVPTSTPTPTKASPTPDSDSARAAFARVVEYRKVYEDILADPKRSGDDLATVARDQAYSTWSGQAEESLGEGRLFKGHSTVNYVSSEDSPNGSNYLVRTCEDASTTDLIGKDGKSVLSPGRPTHAKLEYTMKKDSKTGVYYVVDLKLLATGKSC